MLHGPPSGILLSCSTQPIALAVRDTVQLPITTITTILDPNTGASASTSASHVVQLIT